MHSVAKSTLLYSPYVPTLPVTALGYAAESSLSSSQTSNKSAQSGASTSSSGRRRCYDLILIAADAECWELDRRCHVGLYSSRDGAWALAGDGFVTVRCINRQPYLFVLGESARDPFYKCVITTDFAFRLGSDNSVSWTDRAAGQQLAATFHDHESALVLEDKLAGAKLLEEAGLDEASRLFWHCLHADNQRVPFKEFAQRLCAVEGCKVGDQPALQRVLQVDGVGYVRLSAYITMIRLFGPVHVAAHNLAKVSGKSWFQCHMSRQATEQLLRKCSEPFAYVVRVSATEAGCFALSYYDERREPSRKYGRDSVRSIVHVLVRVSGAGNRFTLNSTTKPYQYSSLDELLVAQFGQPQPTPSAFGAASRVSPYHGTSSQFMPQSQLFSVAVFTLDTQSTPEQWVCRYKDKYVQLLLETDVRQISFTIVEKRETHDLVAYRVTDSAQMSLYETQGSIILTLNGQKITIAFEKNSDAVLCSNIATSFFNNHIDSEAMTDWSALGLRDEVDWETFSAAFLAKYTSHADIAELLKNCFLYMAREGRGVRVAERDVMLCVRDLTAFLSYFGALPAALDQVRMLRAVPWFHWFMSRETVERNLANQPEGTFLIRFASIFGCFAVSHVHADETAARVPSTHGEPAQQIQHNIIRPIVVSGKPVMYEMTDLNGSTENYPSLEAIVQRNRNHLRCPFSTSGAQSV